MHSCSMSCYCLSVPMCLVLLLFVFCGLPWFLGWLLALSVFLYTSAYGFVVCYLSTSTAHFALCWELFLWVCCSTIFMVLNYFLFLLTLPVLSITILAWSLPNSSYQIKVLCVSYILQHCFLWPLCFYPQDSNLNMFAAYLTGIF